MSVDWVPELAAALDGLVPLEDGSGADWDGVLARAGTRRRLRLGRTRHPLRLAIVVALLLLVLAGVATATYFALRGSTGLGFLRTKDGSIAVVDRNGRPREIWNCPPGPGFCGDIASVAWSPDGERLAISSSEIGGRSTYPGLHIIDLKTGADRRIPAVPRYVQIASFRTLRREVLGDIRILGCYGQLYLDWSPDGSRLAYNCLDSRARSFRRWRTRIYTIRPDGTGRRLISIPHIQNAYAPSWSPDGRRIAFSTCEWPVMHKNRFNTTSCHSSVYVVDRDGRHLRRLAAGALPDWSPSGRTIAYVARACVRAGVLNRARIRLVTPSGRDATPSSGRCAGIGPPGSVIPAWSPDGGRIAVATRNALYVMNADGSGLERFLRGNFISRDGGGLIKPLWQPPATTATPSSPALAAASAWPKPAHYAGTTSEHGNVTFKVADHGKRISGFTTVDGYNNMCHFTGAPPHIFHYTVKMPLMKVTSSGSFTGTAKATTGPFTGTFRVKGRFSSGRAHGTVTRVEATCGPGASNPTSSDYLETFTAKRT